MATSMSPPMSPPMTASPGTPMNSVGAGAAAKPPAPAGTKAAAKGRVKSPAPAGTKAAGAAAKRPAPAGTKAAVRGRVKSPAPATKGPVRPVAPVATKATVKDRSRYDFDLPDRAIHQFGNGRGSSARRGLTPVRPATTAALDPIVARAAARLRAKYGREADALRRHLASKHVEEVEAVTDRLNRQSLSRTTRFLLTIDGVYEAVLAAGVDHHKPEKH